jgi:predicted RNA binding protein YcfA (HicA-like mRNA interferase family)
MGLGANKGDHARLVQANGKGRLTVPLRRRELNQIEFSFILRQAGLTRDEFDAKAKEVL